MILSDVFERFAQDSPLSVMAQGVLENALSPRVVDQLFEDVAERQYTAQTQQSRHQPQSSGLDFAEVPKGEEKEVRTGRSRPETASSPVRFRTRRTERRNRRLDQTAHKAYTDKTFGYFAAGDTGVGFRPLRGSRHGFIRHVVGSAFEP